MNPLEEINKKLDAIMKHMGCEYSGGDVGSKEKYMSSSNEDKDKMDEQQILGKT